MDAAKGIAYLGDGDPHHTLDVYSPKNRDGNLPVIVEIHGGAYMTCDTTTNELHGKSLATHGFRVVNVNYTLYPEADFRQQIGEFHAIFDWLDRHAQTYHFDLENVFVTGDSAGGHLTLLLAAIEHSPSLQEYFGVRSRGLKGFAVSCPVFDMQPVLEGQNWVYKMIRRNIPHTTAQELDLLAHVSIPAIIDDCDFPEVFILTTPTDTMFHIEARRLHELLTGRELRHEYKQYESVSNKLDHVFNVAYPDYIESVEANDDICTYFKTKTLTA
ncbi:MAG: alpha/beta hydrolase [Propionicimonas sp.]